MNTVVLWLLVTPLFFALGWFAGRIDMRMVVKEAKKIPNRLYCSLEALVDNNTAIASDSLKDLIAAEPQLTELQFTLGKLYRQRGENDLAIKLHNKLLSSQFLLGEENKELVRLELARDFQKAGLVDRSEGLLLNLITSEFYGHRAQKMLLAIYMQDKNWQEAISSAQKLATSDYNYHTEVAQFNCELASESLLKSDFVQAQAYIQQALLTNKKCVRANIILGEIFFNQENYYQAVETWQLIEKQNYQYLAMVIEKIFESHLRLSKAKEGLTLIKGYALLHPNLNLGDTIYQKLLAYESPEEIIKYLITLMQANPNAKVAVRLIEVNLLNSSQISHEGRISAELIKALLYKYFDKFSNYRCGRCNFKSKTFFWQCPACYEWESINPNNMEI